MDFLLCDLRDELSDVGAFTFGRLFGGIRFGAKSPGKTWKARLERSRLDGLPWLLRSRSFFRNEATNFTGLIVGSRTAGDLSISVISEISN